MLLIRRFMHDCEAATAIEYCLIGGLLSVAILIGVMGIGIHLNSYFAPVNTGLN